MRVLSVFGTRPEAIKMAPVVRALEAAEGIESRLLLSGQHADMVAPVVELFGLRVDGDLQIMRRAQGLTHITTAVLQGMETALAEMRPDFVLVHGDTTTSMAAGLAAFYAGVPFGHVEAGLRTRNLHSPWPEEANRQITGRLARLHFAPTAMARDNLLAEATPPERVIVTGNTVIDALLHVRDHVLTGAAAAEIAARFAWLDPTKRLILVTGHRRENFDGGLERVCRALARLAARGDVEVVYPVHLNPRVRETANAILAGQGAVHLIEPVDYLPFVWLMGRAEIIVTDSGGIQEEGPSLGKPVLVTRDTTERPEAVTAGTVRLVGTDGDAIEREAARLLDDRSAYEAMARAINPYGDGLAAGRIVAELRKVQGS